MNYSKFAKLFDENKITVDIVRQTIDSETVLCLNDEGYYIDNLDDHFGEDDTIDVSY